MGMKESLMAWARDRLISPSEEYGAAKFSTTQLSNGGWVTAWFVQHDNYTYSVRAQVFDSTGAMVGDPLEVSPVADLTYFEIDTIAQPDGAWTVRWALYDSNAAADSEVHYRKYDQLASVIGSWDYGDIQHSLPQKDFADGTFLSNGVKYGTGFIRTDATGAILATYAAPDIEREVFVSDFDILADGGWVVTWRDRSAGTFNMQRYDAEGAISGDRQTLVDGDFISSFVSHVTALSDGGWLVTWTDDEGALFLSRFDADGDTLVDSELMEYPDTAWDRLGNIVALPDGGWMASWTLLGSGKDPKCFIQSFRADGTERGDPIKFGTYFGSTPEITQLDDGGWLATWSGGSAPDGWRSVYQQRFSENGDLVVSHTAPDGTDGEFIVPEDATFVLSEDALGFRDFNRHSFAGATITAASGGGQITLNGHPITFDTFISAKAIAQGRLSWTPDAEEFGTDYATISFKVHDTGDTKNGGQTIDRTANTLTFDVRHVNDWFKGTDGKDVLKGTYDSDRFDGFNGNDRMTGNGGADMFKFRIGHGKDVITDFETAGLDYDRLTMNYSHLISFDSFIKRFVSQRGADTIIVDHTGSHPKDEIVLLGVDMNTLTEEHLSY
jgi:hypothetical protein